MWFFFGDHQKRNTFTTKVMLFISKLMNFLKMTCTLVHSILENYVFKSSLKLHNILPKYMLTGKNILHQSKFIEKY